MNFFLGFSNNSYTDDAGSKNKRIILLFSFFLLVINNISMPYSQYSIMFYRIPSSIRIIFEYFCVLYVLLLGSNLNKSNTISILIILLCFCFSIHFAKLIICFEFVHFAQFLEILSYLVPLILFWGFIRIKLSEKDIDNYLYNFNWFTLLSIIALFTIQKPFDFTVTPDIKTGLFPNANDFSIVLIAYSAYFFYKYYQKKESKNLFLFILFFIFSFFPQNEKAGIIYLMAIILFIIDKKVFGKIRFKPLFYTVMSFWVLYLILYTEFSEIFSIVSSRISEVIRIFRDEIGFGKIPFVQSWVITYNYLTRNLETFFMGIGSANFLGPKSPIMIKDGIINNNVAVEQYYNLNILNNELGGISSFEYITNFFSTMFIEFGFFIGVVFISIIVIMLKRISTKKIDEKYKPLRFAVVIVLVIIIGESALIPFSSWNSSVVIYPTMLISAFLYNMESK